MREIDRRDGRVTVLCIVSLCTGNSSSKGLKGQPRYISGCVCVCDMFSQAEGKKEKEREKETDYHVVDIRIHTSPRRIAETERNRERKREIDWLAY